MGLFSGIFWYNISLIFIILNSFFFFYFKWFHAYDKNAEIQVSKPTGSLCCMHEPKWFSPLCWDIVRAHFYTLHIHMLAEYIDLDWCTFLMNFFFRKIVFFSVVKIVLTVDLVRKNAPFHVSSNHNRNFRTNSHIYIFHRLAELSRTAWGKCTKLWLPDALVPVEDRCDRPFYRRIHIRYDWWTFVSRWSPVWIPTLSPVQGKSKFYFIHFSYFHTKFNLKKRMKLVYQYAVIFLYEPSSTRKICWILK